MAESLLRLLVVSLCLLQRAEPPPRFTPGDEAAALAEAASQMRFALLRQAAPTGGTVGELASRGALRPGFIEAALDACQRVGPVTAYSDGLCEAMLSLPRGRFAGLLERWQVRPAASAPASRPAQADDLLVVSGCVSMTDAQGHPRAEVWRRGGATLAEMAAAAARLDARLALLEQVRELVVKPGVRVGALLNEDPGLAWELRNAIPRMSAGPLRYGPDGRCRLAAVVEIDAFGAGLAELFEKRDEIGSVARSASPEEAMRMSRLSATATVSAEGVGAAPDAPESPPPAWAETCIRAAGRVHFDARSAHVPGVRDAALADARFEARRQLAFRLDALPVGGGRHVRDVLLAHPELSPDLDAWLDRAIDAAPPAATADGVARVELILPAWRLWWLVAPHVGRNAP